MFAAVFDRGRDRGLGGGAFEDAAVIALISELFEVEVEAAKMAAAADAASEAEADEADAAAEGRITAE